MIILSSLMTLFFSVGWIFLLAVFIVIPFVVVPCGLAYLSMKSFAVQTKLVSQKTKETIEAIELLGDYLSQSQINTLFQGGRYQPQLAI